MKRRVRPAAILTSGATTTSFAFPGAAFAGYDGCGLANTGDTNACMQANVSGDNFCYNSSDGSYDSSRDYKEGYDRGSRDGGWR